jgi:hypothetical protein
MANAVQTVIGSKQKGMAMTIPRIAHAPMFWTIAGLGLLLAPLIPAALADPSAAEPPPPAVTPQAASAEERLLQREIESWKETRIGEYEQALKWKRIVNARPDDAHPVRREVADYHQSMGRVEAADGIIRDLERRLDQFEPATPPPAPQNDDERNRAERDLLSSIQSHWQQIRNTDWEYAQQQKQIYNQVAAESPDWAVDRSGPEYHRASGRVEMTDRFLRELQKRMDTLGREIAEAAPPAEAPEPAGHAYPNQPNHGMQITYTVSGAVMDTLSDNRIDTWRTLNGAITGNTLTVSGWVRVGGIGANVLATVWAGDQKDQQWFYVKNTDESGNPTRFRVSIPVEPDVHIGGFGVSITGEYEGLGNSRSLNVDGHFAPAEPPEE